MAGVNEAYEAPQVSYVGFCIELIIQEARWDKPRGQRFAIQGKGFCGR